MHATRPARHLMARATLFLAACSCLALAVSVSFAQAARPEPPAGVVVNPNGSFKWDGVSCAITYFNPAWDSVDQSLLRPARGAVVPDAPRWRWEVAGEIPVVGRKGEFWKLEQSLEKLDPRTLLLDYRADFPSGYPGGTLCLSLVIPINIGAGEVVIFDNEPITLPPALGESELFKRTVDTLSLPTAGGRLTFHGRFHAYLQDGRRWGTERYRLRLSLGRDERRLAVTVTHQPNDPTSAGVSGPAASPSLILQK